MPAVNASSCAGAQLAVFLTMPIVANQSLSQVRKNFDTNPTPSLDCPAPTGTCGKLEAGETATDRASVARYRITVHFAELHSGAQACQ